MKWVETLPLTLLRIRVTLRASEKVSPFEILYDRPYHANLTGKPEQMHIVGEKALAEYLLSLNKVLSSLYR